MIKRALCVIMCCVIAAALSLSVFAVDFPNNNTEGYISISDFLFGSTTGATVRPNTWKVPFGHLGLTYIENYLNALKFNCNFNFDIVVTETSTIYFPFFVVNNSFNPSLTSDSLSPYRSAVNDIVIDFSSSGSSVELYYLEATGSPIVPQSPSIIDYTISDCSITFKCFENVPSGTYSLNLNIPYGNIVDKSIPIEFFFGCFVSQSFGAVGDFENGSISFNDAISQVQGEINNIINSDLTDSEKMIALEIEFNNIERIKDISDVKFNGAVNSFVSSADSVIDSYNNGSIDINTAISNIQMTYFDALSQSVTPEQGTYLNTANQVKLTELQLNWQSNYKEELDTVITDEDLEVNSEKLSHLDELHNQEMEVLSHFELAEFESKLEFSLWTDTLPSDYSNYKSIFEYFLEDNKAYQISQFLIVPFSLVLVSVLLATTTVVLRRNRNG